MNMEVEESPFDNGYEIKFVRKVDLDQEMHDTAEITFLGSSQINQEMEEADSKLEYMPDDEIIYVLGNDDSDDDADDDDSDKPSVTDEIAADKVIDKLVSIANTRNVDANVPDSNASESDPLKFADKMDSTVPKLVADAFAEKMPDILSDSLKNIVP
nr:hypothetical protein [Tanacetum cinerariifolium]